MSRPLLFLALVGCATDYGIPPIGQADELPLTESESVAVSTSGSTDKLTNGSPVPDTTDVETDPCALDEPPSLRILSPSDLAIFEGEGAVSITVEVRDDHDLSMDVQLRSDVDGLVAEAVVGTGVIDVVWDGPRSTGDHLLSLRAFDSCGQEATAALEVCQQGGYVADDLDLGTWALEGDASFDVSNDWLQLTPATTYQQGGAFQIAHEVSGAMLDVRFDFFIGEGSGADGLALTALDLDRATEYLGNDGSAIGYEDLPGWTVEVDVFPNGGGMDSAEDHLSLTFDGNLATPEVSVDLPEMEDTGWHTMHVIVDAPHVWVQVDGVTYIDDAYPGYWDFPAHIGFTAATGSYDNVHLVDSLRVVETVCEQP